MCEYYRGNVLDWDVGQVVKWATDEKLHRLVDLLKAEEIDGKALLMLTERDLQGQITIGLRKNLLLAIRQLQRTSNYATLDFLGLLDPPPAHQSSSHHNSNNLLDHHHDLRGFVGNGVGAGARFASAPGSGSGGDMDRISPASSTVDGVGGGGGRTGLTSASSTPASNKPEFFKTFVSVVYAFLVTWITAFVMVVVHERVPDMKRYPPLPDIFLDNVPHIPWAFNMCEVTGTLLFGIWVFVLVVHKHRIILLRRFFALGGTVFLLRCVTMLITSLSVPGTHLQCTSSDHQLSEDSAITLAEAISLRVQRAYTIWSGLGMSIQGVRTCGDYMFSGHTVSLTLLNFFITEYTPRRLYFLHTITWLLNMFGIFFILAAHEHYSIDVFVAFYISSRLFLYYHTLANNHALMSHDSNRTRVWFPMFSYFESSVRGMTPNEYDTLGDVLRSLMGELLWGLVTLKDLFMLTARRAQLEQSIRERISASRKSSMTATTTTTVASNNNNDTTRKDLNRAGEAPTPTTSVEKENKKD